jgi:hypothetical protein
MESIIARKYQALSPELNERQRRLWAASETQSLGYGGNCLGKSLFFQCCEILLDHFGWTSETFLIA